MHLWYNNFVIKSVLAETSSRGCMVIKPWLCYLGKDAGSA
jgi:hypothetical protein